MICRYMKNGRPESCSSRAENAAAQSVPGMTITRRSAVAGIMSLAAPASAAVIQEPTVVATGLRFPEGPVALPGGELLVSEIAAGRITRVRNDGSKTAVAVPGGGPNGLAFGPDGLLYCCNNGGFTWNEQDGLLLPGTRVPDYAGGWIDRIDPATGRVTKLYENSDAMPLSAPNDLVFAADGGFWFTDHGSTTARYHEHGAIFYATADGREINRVVSPESAPNGIALSPDGRKLYVALTLERQVLAFDVVARGKLSPTDPFAAVIAADLPGRAFLDSMKVDAEGNLCLATLVDGAVRTIKPSGSELDRVSVPDMIPTNLAFGGPDLRDLWITRGTTGQLFRTRWPRAGLALHYQSR